MSRLLKIAEVSMLTALSPSTVRRLIADGRLASVRLTPRTVRIPEDTVRALMAGAKNRE